MRLQGMNSATRSGEAAAGSPVGALSSVYCPARLPCPPRARQRRRERRYVGEGGDEEPFHDFDFLFQ